MTNSTSQEPRIGFWAMRQVAGYCEPMRTRAVFYLGKIAKSGRDLTQEDVYVATGRAFSDRENDAAIEFDGETTKRILEDSEGFRDLDVCHECFG